MWQFFQDEILGMKWLNELIGQGLVILGIDINDRLGGSIQFFFIRCDKNNTFTLRAHFSYFVYSELLSTGAQ